MYLTNLPACLVVLLCISLIVRVSAQDDHSTWAFVSADSFNYSSSPNSSRSSNVSLSCVPDIWLFGAEPVACFNHGRCVVVFDLSHVNISAFINQSTDVPVLVSDVLIDLHLVEANDLPLAVCLCDQGYNSRPDTNYPAASHHLNCAVAESEVMVAMIAALCAYIWLMLFATYKLYRWFKVSRHIESAANSMVKQSVSATRNKRGTTTTLHDTTLRPSTMLSPAANSLKPSSTRAHGLRHTQSHGAMMLSPSPVPGIPSFIRTLSPDNNLFSPVVKESFNQRVLLPSLSRLPRAISAEATLDPVNIILRDDGSARPSIISDPNNGLPVCVLDNRRTSIPINLPINQPTNPSAGQPMNPPSKAQAIGQPTNQSIIQSTPVNSDVLRTTSRPSITGTVHKRSITATESGIRPIPVSLNRLPSNGMPLSAQSQTVSKWVLFKRHGRKLQFLIPLFCFLCGCSGVAFQGLWLATDMVFFRDWPLSLIYYCTYLFGFIFITLSVYFGIKIRLSTMGRIKSTNMSNQEVVRLARKTLISLGIVHVIVSTLIFAGSTASFAAETGALGVVGVGAVPFYLVASFGVYNLYRTQSVLSQGIETLSKQQQEDRMRIVRQLRHHAMTTGALLALLVIGTTLFVVVPYLRLLGQFYLFIQSFLLSASGTARMRMMNQPHRSAQVRPMLSKIQISRNSASTRTSIAGSQTARADVPKSRRTVSQLPERAHRSSSVG